MNTTQLKEFAELAEAAYALFLPSDYKSVENTINRLKSTTGTPNGTFSEAQAIIFTSQYTLLHQSTENTLDGFSATVFQDKINGVRHDINYIRLKSAIYNFNLHKKLDSVVRFVPVGMTAGV